jgi:hypothetical protein
MDQYWSKKRKIQSTITMTQNNMYNCKSRLICCRNTIVKHLLLNIIISIDYIKSKKNIVDLLTKDLSRKLIYNSLREIGRKLLKIKEYNYNNLNLLTRDLKI